MFYIEQTIKFLAMWGVSGTKKKGEVTAPITGLPKEAADSLSPEAAFWIWLLVSLAAFAVLTWALFSNLHSAVLHLPSRGTPPPVRRTCACGYPPDWDEEDCPQCGLKLPSRVAEHLQKYRGAGRKSRPIK
jgi:hypothetical protein